MSSKHRGESNRPSVRKCIACVAAIWLSNLSPVDAAEVSLDWKTECVGQFQLILPGDAEVGALSQEALLSELSAGTPQPRSSFIDGQMADYSQLWLGGRLLVSHPLTEAGLSKAVSRQTQNRQRTAQWVKTNPKTSSGAPRQFEIPQTRANLSIASRVDASYTVLLAVGQSALYWTVNSNPQDRWSPETFSAVDAAQPRGIFQAPNQSGACVPYAFIAYESKIPRSIGVTYRSKSHPDLTIWLEDSSPRGSAKGDETLTPEYVTDFFWRQRYQDPKKLKWLWHRLHEVKLDGREGVASFVELTRTDDTIDYGYLAVVRGDPDAKVDTPDLMLYVIRDSKNAIAKGKKPIDKDEFLKMAEAIAASVKHRPVQ